MCVSNLFKRTTRKITVINISVVISISVGTLRIYLSLVYVITVRARICD